MNSVLALLDRALRLALVLLMSAMVMAVTWQVVSRYLLGSPSSWTEEVARFVLIWIGMLGAAYAFRRRMHIGLDLLPTMSAISMRRLRWFTQGVIVLFAVAVLILGGGSLMLLTWELRQTSAALELPIAVVYSVIPLTGILIVLYSLPSFTAAFDADTDEEPD